MRPSTAVFLIVLNFLAANATGQAALDDAGVEAEAQGWTLQLTDDFDRTGLDPNCKTVRGTWKLENGMRVASDSAHVVSTWRCTGDVRLEYEAVSEPVSFTPSSSPETM